MIWPRRPAARLVSMLCARASIKPPGFGGADAAVGVSADTREPWSSAAVPRAPTGRRDRLLAGVDRLLSSTDLQQLQVTAMNCEATGVMRAFDWTVYLNNTRIGGGVALGAVGRTGRLERALENGEAALRAARVPAKAIITAVNVCADAWAPPLPLAEANRDAFGVIRWRRYEE